MSQSAESRVSILGAGCSANYGYPLGNALIDQLQRFQAEIPEDCALIRQSVTDTIALAARYSYSLICVY